MTSQVKPTALVTRRMPSAVLAPLYLACDVDLHDHRDSLAHADLCARLVGKHGLICMFNDRIDEVAISAGNNLKVISTVAVGVDNIDMTAAKNRGIVVTNTPDILAGATAELTWALLLAVMRRVGEGDRLIRNRKWNGWAFDFLLGTELRGKQLGIVGAGRIGQAVAAIATGFGMRAVYVARPGQSEGEVVSAVPVLSLDELLLTSDVVSVHVPLTEDTRHLINRRTLVRMKRSAFLINTSRGGVVDDTALAWALDQRLIAGVGLDVFEDEPQVHSDLIARENVCLTPHLGSATRETRTAMAELAVRNVLEVLEGRSALTPVVLDG